MDGVYTGKLVFYQFGNLLSGVTLSFRGHPDRLLPKEFVSDMKADELYEERGTYLLW